MSKILFVTWPGGGNQPPAIGLAQQLRRDGHETMFAGYIDQASRFRPSTSSSHSSPAPEPRGQSFDIADLMPLLVKHTWACPDHVADTAEILDRYQPDLVVVDCLMGGVLAAMETSHIPTVALVHSAPGALAPPGGPIDGFVIGELNRIRFALDLTPVDSYWQAWQQHDVICASIPELDPLGTDTLHPVTWIGPVFEDLTPTDWMPDDHHDTPLVLVSFNSGGAWDQTSRIQRTIDGLAGADLTGDRHRWRGRPVPIACSHEGHRNRALHPARRHSSLGLSRRHPRRTRNPHRRTGARSSDRGDTEPGRRPTRPRRTGRTPRRRHPPPRRRGHCDRHRLRSPNRARRPHLRRQRPGPRRPHPHLQQSATCSH